MADVTHLLIAIERGDPDAAGQLWPLVYDELRRLAGALACFREAVRVGPEDARGHNNLGFALQDKGDWDGALAAYREAVRLDAKLALAHSNLAAVLATGPDRVRDGKRAVEHATRACELTGWKNPSCIATLGVACAEVGAFGKAVEHQTKALSFPEYERQHGAVARERLSLYGRKQPYRDPSLAAQEVAPPPRAVKP